MSFNELLKSLTFADAGIEAEIEYDDQGAGKIKPKTTVSVPRVFSGTASEFSQLPPEQQEKFNKMQEHIDNFNIRNRNIPGEEGEFERLQDETMPAFAQIKTELTPAADPANVAGAASGATTATIGIPGDIVGLTSGALYGIYKLAFPNEDETRLQSAARGFANVLGTVSETAGSMATRSVFDGWLDTMPLDEETKAKISEGADLGEWFSVPGAGAAVALGKKGVMKGAQKLGDFVANAPDRIAAREADTAVQLNAGVDVPAAVDQAIVGAQKLAGKTDEPQPLDVNPEVVQLTPEEKSGSIIPQLYEGEEIAPPEAGKRTIFDVANEIDARTQKSGATADVTPANKTRIAKLMAAETLHAMRKAGNAGDWYRTKVDNAMKIAERVYPDVMQDPNKSLSLKFITAITSNGASVQDNAERTFQIFDDFLATNRMPEKLEFGGGKERPAMEFAFKLYNDMVDEMGETEFFDFISQEFTVRELDEIGKKYGFKVSGEAKDTTLPASVIFGPKIGGGFYQNLNGNYKPLTMDRWFMRSWGRYTGSLVVKQSEKTARQQLDRIRSEVTPEIAAEYGYSHNELLADDDLLIELAQRAHKDYVKSGYKNKTELNKASKNFVEAQKKVLEAPGGGKQRNFMRETVDEALEILRQQGIELDRAALQALIWYPEKELYAKFGVGSKRSAPTDYETEFAKIANSRGVDVSDITGNANTE